MTDNFKKIDDLNVLQSVISYQLKDEFKHEHDILIDMEQLADACSITFHLLINLMGLV